MNPSLDSLELRAISALLGREICRPLAVLEASLNQLFANPDQFPSSSERGYAVTMLELCDDLRRLTIEQLGSSDDPDPKPEQVETHPRSVGFQSK